LHEADGSLVRDGRGVPGALHGDDRPDQLGGDVVDLGGAIDLVGRRVAAALPPLGGPLLAGRLRLGVRGLRRRRRDVARRLPPLLGRRPEPASRALGGGSPASPSALRRAGMGPSTGWPRRGAPGRTPAQPRGGTAPVSALKTAWTSTYRTRSSPARACVASAPSAP